MPFKGNPPKIDEPPQHTDATHSFSLFVREKPILIRGISTALYSMWSFHLHSVVKIQPFSPVFPLAGTTAKAFFRLSLWSFKEKASIIFYNTAFRKHQKNECPAQLAPSLLPPFFVTKAVRHCFAPPERFSRLLPWCPRRGAGDFRIPRDT